MVTSHQRRPAWRSVTTTNASTTSSSTTPAWIESAVAKTSSAAFGWEVG